MRWPTIDFSVSRCVPYAGEDPKNRPKHPYAVSCLYCGIHTPLVPTRDGMWCPPHLPVGGLE